MWVCCERPFKAPALINSESECRKQESCINHSHNNNLGLEDAWEFYNLWWKDNTNNFHCIFFTYFYLLNICEGFMDTWSFFFFFETWHHQVLHAILNVVYWSWISYPGLCLVFKNNIALYVSSVLMYGMSH